MITGLHHQGLQVANLNKTLGDYQAMGFELEKEFERADLFAKAAHIRYPQGGRLEFWEFSERHADHEFIQNHTAFASDNLEDDLQLFVDNGCKIVIPITQGAVARYAFVQDELGHNLELLEKKA